MAAKLAAQPAWDGSTTLTLEPSAAPGKDKYLDAEHLLVQTKLAIDVFEATHFAPGRWAFHPSKHGAVSRSTYPTAFEAVWLPPVRCKGLFFFDHSSGHGAYSKDALLASNANKGPDWKGTVAHMRDGLFLDDAGAKKVQRMQFEEGDILACDIVCPPGIDLHADAQARAAVPEQPAAAEVSPPSAAELEASYKLWMQGCSGTLKKHNPTLGQAELQALTRSKWADMPTERKFVYLARVRAKAAAGPQQTAGERTLKAGTVVPRSLWGRHKGFATILSERHLYPSAGLKGVCPSGQTHSGKGDCCCMKLLSVQPDFAAECSALQHLVEDLVSFAELTLCRRHTCIFLPKFHCELNWIERLWGAVKQYARSHCLYTLPGLRETVRIALSQDVADVPAHLTNSSELPVAPIHLQRRWARISRRYIAEYRKGLDGAEAIQAVKKLSSKRHRDTSDGRLRSIEAAMADATREGLSSL